MTFIRYLERPKLENPLLIEGLPGMGNVGKLAAEHLIDELGAKRFVEICSGHFPPQVIVDSGILRMVSNNLYWTSREKTRKKEDLIILTGDYQGLTPEGQYELSNEIIDLVKGLGVQRIYTLGGYATQRLVDHPSVLGAATNSALMKEAMKYGVKFSGEPRGGIIGASGLLLGLGAIHGLEGICLMGETPGYFADPKSARAVLDVLTRMLDIHIGFSKLEEKAHQMDQFTRRMIEMRKHAVEAPRAEDLGYIG
jgi:hypothetical protein